MSEAQHTPGPWELRECDIVAPSVTGLNGGLTVVASLYGRMSGRDTGADMRLFAAAPELLDAMEDVLPTLIGLHIATEQQSASTEDAIAKMSAAIAKARGGAS